MLDSERRERESPPTSPDEPRDAPDAPPVVAVLVTHDPGEWFTSTLEALAGQDYPDLRIVVVDSGSAVDISERVQQILPDASVHRLDKNVGFGAAANEILESGMAEAEAVGAEFFLFCHDDIAPDPTATQVLVETAIEHDASVVGPKLVRWDDPRWVLQMGQVVDKTATVVPLIESDELDQGQHDGLREVFAVPGGVTLVRARAFQRIGGFDEAIKLVGDDLSLCWRARIAGGRVLVTSATRVRHRQALPERVARGLPRRLAARSRLRVLLTCYGRVHVWRVLPQVGLLSLFGIVGALATTRFSDARASAGAWWWNLRRLPSLWIARGQVRRFRRVGDATLRQLQVPGLTRSSRVVRRHAAATAESLPLAGNGRTGTLEVSTGGEPSSPAGQPGYLLGRQSRSHRAWTSGALLLLLALAGVLVMGSRHLLTRGVPVVGELVPFDSPGSLFDEWRSGWRRAGLGSDDPAPSILGALSALGVLADGSMALLRTALTVGMIPLGVLGAFRLLRPSGSPRAPVAAAVAYAVVPVPYAALSAGRWAPLAAYAAAPWLLSRLARGSGAPPYAPRGNRATGRSGLAVHALVLGVMTALLAMLVPAAPVVVSVLVAGLALGSLLAFEARYIGRMVVVAVGGVLVAALLHLPWSLASIDWVRASGDALPTWLGLHRASGGSTTLDMLGLSTVAPTVRPYAWALLAAAGLALFVGRGWRLGWAIRGWTIAVACWGLTSASQRGVFQVPLPDLDVLMALAGLGLALAIGCGAAAVEHDVAGRSRRFGLRRTVTAFAAVAMGVAVVPLVRGSIDGYWGMPRGDFSSLLGTVDDDLAAIPSRVLWLGHPDVLPVHGWPIEPDGGGLAYATTLRGQPTVQDLWPGPAGEATERIAAAVNLARAQQTTRLGSMLAPMAVQYIAVPQRLAPSSFVGAPQPRSQDLLDGLAEQLDLERVQADPAFVLYRNLAFLPARAAVVLPAAGEGLPATDPAGASRQASPADVAMANPSQVEPALGDNAGFAHDRGELAGDVVVLQSATASERWTLLVGGVPVERGTAFGWANQFSVAAPGPAELRYETPPERDIVLLVQAALWLLILLVVVQVHHRVGMRQSVGIDEDAVPRAVRQWIEIPQDEFVRVVPAAKSHHDPDASQGNGDSELGDLGNTTGVRTDDDSLEEANVPREASTSEADTPRGASTSEAGSSEPGTSEPGSSEPGNGDTGGGTHADTPVGTTP